MVRTILICSGHRSEAGLLQPVMDRILKHPKLQLLILHVNPENSFGTIYKKTDEAIKKVKPNIVVVPTDRREMVPVALAAFYQNIPIAHFLGGAKGVGTHDDIIRHVISMLAHIIFCEDEKAANRLKKMGIEDWRIIISGLTAFDDIDPNKLDNSLVPNEPYDLVLYHPHSMFPEKIENELLTIDTIISNSNRLTVWIEPNKEMGYENRIISFLDRYFGVQRVMVLKSSIPRLQYLALLKNCKRVIGNSSSLIFEAPFFNIPVIQIGIRNSEREKPEKIEIGGSDKIVKVLSEIPLDNRLMRKRIGYYENG